MKKLKFMFSLFGIQFLTMHYFIYFALSWDVMEPVACLVGLMDVNIAILYTILTGQDYSYSTIHDRRAQNAKSIKDLD